MNCFQVLYPSAAAAPFAAPAGYTFPYHNRIHHHQPSSLSTGQEDEDEPPMKKRFQEKNSEGFSIISSGFNGSDNSSNNNYLYRSVSFPRLSPKEELSTSHHSPATKSSTTPVASTTATPPSGGKLDHLPTTEYLATNCVLLTYFTGDVSEQVDEHFTKALAQPSSFNLQHQGTIPAAWKNKHTGNLSASVETHFPPPSSLWKSSAAFHHPSPSSATSLHPPARPAMQEFPALGYVSASIAPTAASSYGNFDSFFPDWRYSFGPPCGTAAAAAAAAAAVVGQATDPTPVFDHRRHVRSNQYDVYNHPHRHHAGFHNLTLSSMTSPPGVEEGRLAAAAAAVHYNNLLHHMTGSCRSDPSSKFLPVSNRPTDGSDLWRINRTPSDSRSTAPSHGHRQQLEYGFDASAPMFVGANDPSAFVNELYSYGLNGL
jgi:hypothetical protein